MRLHQLTLTAFGPFPGTETVDFDELCDAGLFLLTGPTGAGKTSILDAVCFALYGTVPGVRGVKTLKSQHAPVDRRPEVELDFSIGGRRFRLRRSPEWSRPKRRGEGWRTENAAATLVETTSGSDHLLSSRAQEVGHFVSELTGMRASQFVQVAMLPQGDFQRFLRATSQERHEVLQHLFRTDRFSRIEDWVHEHSRDLRDRSASGQAAVQRVLDTMADRAGVELPEELSAESLAASAEDGAVATWADGLVASADEALAGTSVEHAAARDVLQEARVAFEEAGRLARAEKRATEARAVLAELAGTAAEAEQAALLLAGDERAARCLPVLRLSDETEQQLETAAQRRDRALRRVRTLPDQVWPLLEDAGLARAAEWDADALEAGQQAVQSRIGRLDSLRPRERALEVARAECAAAERLLTQSELKLSAADEVRRTWPEQEAALRERLDEAARVAARVDALVLTREAAADRAEAAEQVPGAEQRLADLRDEARTARDRAADARDLVQDLLGRRLAGIAAELAGRLEDGAGCPVCGSAEHPAPAAPADDAVTEADQEAAAAAHDAAQGAYTAAVAAVSDAEQRLSALVQRTDGRDVASARAELADLDAELGRVRAAADEVPRLRTELEAARAGHQQLLERCTALQATIATATETVRSQSAVVAEATGELAEGLGEFDQEVGPRALTELVQVLQEVSDVLAEGCRAVTAHETAAQRRAELADRLRAVLAEHDFAGADEVRAAAMPEAARSRLEQLAEQRQREQSRATAVLEDPEVRALADRPVPDLAALESALASSAAVEDAAARAHHDAEQVATALRRLRASLDEALVAWAPVRASFVRAESMSKLVRGMGVDNQLQMRLSAYVLATRLDQVVAAANERLEHMRDQRYVLQRTGRSTRKGAQAGLGLEVVDQWTGDVRDPLTLSGGETFVVSLALALGLADVVTQESGGTEIQTLFVDEGFGTLDAETLDDVMDRLDALRAGGRAVGVVSHVSELRNRIPTQVHVEKTRTGSSVSVRTLVG